MDIRDAVFSVWLAASNLEKRPVLEEECRAQLEEARKLIEEVLSR